MVTVSSSVSASLSSSTIRGLTGCIQDLQVVDVPVSPAERGVRARPHRESAPAAVAGRPGAPQHVAHRAGTALDAGVHVAIGHDGAMTEDHEVRLA